MERTEGDGKSKHDHSWQIVKRSTEHEERIGCGTSVNPKRAGIYGYSDSFYGNIGFDPSPISKMLHPTELGPEPVERIQV